MGYRLQASDLSRERERQRSAGAFARRLPAEFDEAAARCRSGASSEREERLSASVAPERLRGALDQDG